MSDVCPLHPDGPVKELTKPFTLDQCRRCWVLRFGADRRRVASRVALPCVYVGDPAGPAGYHLCDHPDEPLGAIVCSCKGCGTRCPGYKSSETA